MTRKYKGFEIVQAIGVKRNNRGYRWYIMLSTGLGPGARTLKELRTIINTSLEIARATNLAAGEKGRVIR